MIYCPYCGKPINKEQVICLSCGRQIQPLKVENVIKEGKNNCKIGIIIIVTLISVMLLVTTLPMFFT